MQHLVDRAVTADVRPNVQYLEKRKKKQNRKKEEIIRNGKQLEEVVNL